MKTLNTKNLLRNVAILVVAATALGGCNSLSRLAKVGEEPEMNDISNPTHAPNYQPVSMPMPATLDPAPNANSLWRPGSRAFLKDLRASEIGDIVTVDIDISGNASLSNQTTRTRANSESAGVDNLFGYENSLGAILPESVVPATMLGIDSNVSNVGSGAITRSETVVVQIAATVVQVLPNGNLVIHGLQETRINFEVRELQIAGIIRPQDITTENVVSYEKIAEARMAYGGRGHISDVQQPRYGSQILDAIMPF